MLNTSFYQLLVVYTLLIVAIALGFLSKFTLHFEIFAVILALLGITILTKTPKQTLEKSLTIKIFLIGILAIFAFRAIPYLKNSIPLGYDAGIYKFAIEHGLNNPPSWIYRSVEPGFLYLMKPLSLIFSTHFMLTWLFIIFNIILGISIFFFAKEYFGNRTAAIAILLYAVSIVQFKVFTYMYYKNIIGLSLMLFALYFLNKNTKYSRYLFIILGGILGTIHRPTFYIFGLSYFAYAVISPYSNKKYSLKKLNCNIINGILILIIATLFYIGKFRPAITSMFAPVLNSFIESGEAPGTFISFFSYQFSTLAYLPFAILGFFYLIKSKHYNALFFWTLINATIVYFQFFFFNRFIIHLDIALIILAAAGFTLLIDKKPKFGIVILITLILSAGFLTYNEANNAIPTIPQYSLTLIEAIPYLVTPDSKIISISSEYSPWILAYSNRTVIAPGLFDDSPSAWTEDQWNSFWNTQDEQTTRELLQTYTSDDSPIFLYAGSRTFDNPCFALFQTHHENKLYGYTCYQNEIQ